MRFAALGLALAFLGVAGCTASPVTVKGDTLCSVARPLSWSRRDTSTTVDGIRRHNARYRRVCG